MRRTKITILASFSMCFALLREKEQCLFQLVVNKGTKI